MATNPVQPPVPANPTPDQYDELSGVYGFFRRHQKKLLYTAGLFTLLTFSITGSMTALVGNWFGSSRPMPKMVVNGKEVAMQPEDYTFGQQLERGALQNRLPQGVLPRINPGDNNATDLGQVYAMLRRAAIAEGLDVSSTDVDLAIGAMRESTNSESPTKLARDAGFTSLAQFREVVTEAMRVGNYIRLQTLALDSSDAKVLAAVLKDREKITLRVASFDEKKAEEELKTKSPLSEEALKEWLAGKTERDKRMMQAYDLPRARLRFAALLLAEGQFDPAQWQDGYLKDFTVSDEQLSNLYNQEKENRFKLEGDKQYKPADDPAVKAELTRLIQAEHVMNQLLAAVRAKQSKDLEPLSNEVARTQAEVGTSEASFAERTKKADEMKAELVKQEAALAAAPEDAALKAAVEKLKADIKAIDEELFAAKDALPAVKAAKDAADKALQEARSTFDFPAALAELTKDKSGFVQKEMTDLRTGEEMKDLDALGLDLGKWPFAAQGASLRNKGDLGFAPGRTTKAVMLYQALEVQPLPEKPWDKLKPLAEGAYYTEQAKKLGEEKKKAMEEALLRLAKEKMPAKVTELEGQRQKRIDDKVAEWEKATQGAIDVATKHLADLKPGTQAHAAWQRELDTKKAELAQKDLRRTGFEAEIKNAIDAEIATEAKKHHRDVLDAAAAAAGYTVADLPALPRDLPTRDPRFDKNHDPAVVFLLRNHGKLKEGESTGLVQDFANRAYYVAVCTKVEPLTVEDVTRRDYEGLRSIPGYGSFAAVQAMVSYNQAFTLEAVEKRYQVQREVGEVREEAKK